MKHEKELIVRDNKIEQLTDDTNILELLLAQNEKSISSLQSNLEKCLKQNSEKTLQISEVISDMENICSEELLKISGNKNEIPKLPKKDFESEISKKLFNSLNTPL